MTTSPAPTNATPPAGKRERYGIVGTGSRARMYIDALVGPYAETAELVAWSDTNSVRLDYYEVPLAAAGHPLPVRYAADDVAEMVRAERLDRVIVTSPDYTHAAIVAAALRAGADVVVEKPLTIDAVGVAQIADALAESGRSVLTTFNYRYSPRNSALKRVIASGQIGEVTSVHFEWMLDTVHGADYFRRWHRYKDKSGGLLVHKASHHFDLVNWWIAAAPTRVFASGGLRFYGAENAARRGLAERPERGTGNASDPFALDLSRDERLKALYLDAEHVDGYLRDRDVFDAGITIEDNLAVLVDYDSGATMSYSLNAHSPWEGYRVVINGTEGRAELDVVERGAALLGDDGVVVDPSAQPGGRGGEGATDAVRPTGDRLIVQRHWESAAVVPIDHGSGGHGGGDEQMLAHLFARVTEDELDRPADFLGGVRAVSVGIAGNRSLATGLPVRTSELGLPASAWSAAGVDPGAPAAAPAPARLAIVGINGHGRSHVLRAQELTRQGMATLVAVADPRPAEPGTLAADVLQFDSLAELLAGVDVDVVVLCTPIHTHFDLARLALEAGADALLEKPPVTSVADFAALAAIIRATGRRVQVGFQSLGSHAIASIRESVSRGDVGTVTGVAASGNWLRTREYWDRAAWAGKRVLGGIEVVDGVVTNPLAHAVATALCLAGATRAEDVASVELDQFRANDIECDDTSVVRIRTATGLPVTLGLTLCAAERSEPSVTVQGTTGRIVFYYVIDLVQVFRDGRSEPVTTMYGRTPLLDDLLRKRGGEETGLVADFAETEAFTIVLDAVRRAEDPRPIPAEYVDWVGEGADAHPVVRGIEDALARAGREHKTFAELGLPWAMAGALAAANPTGGPG